MMFSMKKIIFSAAVLALAAVGYVQANQNNTVANDLTLENIEKVAQGEYIYLPELENGYRCVYWPLSNKCTLDFGAYQACWDPVNCKL